MYGLTELTDWENEAVYMYSSKDSTAIHYHTCWVIKAKCSYHEILCTDLSIHGCWNENTNVTHIRTFCNYSTDIIIHNIHLFRYASILQTFIYRSDTIIVTDILVFLTSRDHSIARFPVIIVHASPKTHSKCIHIESTSLFLKHICRYYAFATQTISNVTWCRCRVLIISASSHISV